MAGGWRGGGRRDGREVSQAVGEKDVQSEGEDGRFHAPLPLSRVPRMKIQAPSQEIKRSSWGVCPAQGDPEKGLSENGRGSWGRKSTDNLTLT